MTDVKAQGRRQRQVLETRRRIREAASRLFVDRGYGGTTMQQIAAEADVAWQTVYSVFGNKAAIVSEIFDVMVAGDDESVAVSDRSFVRDIREARDPREKARLLAAHFREATARSADVQGVIEAAAATDEDMAKLWKKLLDQLATGMTQAAKALRAQGALRPDLSIAQATDRLWWYAGPWAYRGLVKQRGWTLDEYESWLEESLYDQVMVAR